MNTTINVNNLPVATEQIIKDLVTTFCNADQLFSKYDVTKQLRHNGYWVDHSDVKRVIDQEIDLPDDYTKSMHRVRGRAVQVMHNEYDDVTDYDPDSIKHFKVNHGVNRTSVSVTYSFDKRKRFSVKAKHVRDAGFGAGKQVNVEIGNGEIKIGNNNSNRIVTIDCYSNIRLRKNDFIAAFGSIPSDIDVSVSDKEIIIKNK